jgi:hypothetical protein
VHPIGGRAPEPVEILEAPFAERLHLHEGRGRVTLQAVQAREPLVGILDDMRQRDRPGHQLIRPLAGRLENDNRTLVARRMSRTTRSADSFGVEDFWLIFSPSSLR